MHQKAIEVYSHIFATLGREGLAANLQTYFAGLSSVLSFASLSVRPAFLSLIEAYLLPLDAQAIRPALKAVILALLPGLEDDTSEDFDRVLSLLDGFRKVATGAKAQDLEREQSTAESYFWQCLFLATITNASRRQGALAYLTRKLPRISASSNLAIGDRRGSLADLSPEARALISPEPGLLVRCFASGLSDGQLLIQRGFLDLLVTHLPLSSTVLQSTVQPEDLQRLAMAAAGVVNRRDMSLNRRLWSWFLGPEPKAGTEDAVANDSKSTMADTASHHAAYFSQFGAKPLTAGILKLIKMPGATSTDRARPFRICLSLMDRWEVGGLIVPEIFIPALESVFTYSLSASKEQTDEVVRSASLFFDGVESGLIWSKLFELCSSAFVEDASSKPDLALKLQLYHFCITRFNVREEEMLLYHMPLSLLAFLAMFWRLRQKTLASDAEVSVLTQAYKICDVLIHMVPSRAFDESSISVKSTTKSDRHTLIPKSESEIVETVRRFYDYQQSGTDTNYIPYSSEAIGSEILRLGAKHFKSALEQRSDIEQCTRLLNDLIHKIPNHGSELEDLGITTALHAALQSAKAGQSVTFPAISAVTTVTAALHINDREQKSFTETLPTMVATLVPLLWTYLSPINSKYHVEAVRCLWTLEAVSSSTRLVESALTRLIQQSETADAARRFATIWNHTVQERGASGSRGRGSVVRRVSGMPGLPSGKTTTVDYETMLTRPLFAILDSLAGDENEIAAFTSAWLQELPTLHYVFTILIGNLGHLDCLQPKKEAGKARNNQHRDTGRSNDIKESIYLFGHLQHVLELGSDHTWMTLAGESINGLEHDADGKPQQIVVQNVLIELCMRALDLKQGPFSDMLQRSALAIIQRLLRSPFAAPLKEMELEVALLDKLQRSLTGMHPLLQGTMLQTILAALQLQVTTPTALPPLLSPSSHTRKMSKDLTISVTRASVAGEKEPSTVLSKPPPSLLPVLRAGFSSQSTQLALDSWVDFFEQVMPLFADSIFQTMIPLVEIFCSQIKSIFSRLQSTFEGAAYEQPAPEPSLVSLMNGLEHLLSQAHQQLLDHEAVTTARPKSPEASQGFFATMVPGVFSSDVQQVSRSATANNRLTVLLCFQDTVRMCFSLWTWGVKGTGREQDSSSLASFSYTSLRVRNRARRLLEHLFAVEALECLETLCVVWCHPPDDVFDRASVINLLNVLNGSKPKKTVPAMFNALYSRTNPSVLEAKSLSTLTSDLTDTEIAWFLLEYTRSLEDDTMDEIWTDCVTFLKDVLTNPLPHRQALPALLEFIAVLAEKVENTNFGEERKMRRELSVSMSH